MKISTEWLKSFSTRDEKGFSFSNSVDATSSKGRQLLPDSQRACLAISRTPISHSLTTFSPTVPSPTCIAHREPGHQQDNPTLQLLPLFYTLITPSLPSFAINYQLSLPLSFNPVHKLPLLLCFCRYSLCIRLRGPAVQPSSLPLHLLVLRDISTHTPFVAASRLQHISNSPKRSHRRLQIYVLSKWVF